MVPDPGRSLIEQNSRVETASSDLEQTTKLQRVDSRMALQFTLPTKIDLGRADAVALPSSRRSSTDIDKDHMEKSPQPPTVSNQFATNYLFSFVDPSGPADKEDLRRRRKHVMDVYNDRGAPSHQTGKKRKRTVTVPLNSDTLTSKTQPNPHHERLSSEKCLTRASKSTAKSTSIPVSPSSKLIPLQFAPAPTFIPVDDGMVVPRTKITSEAPLYLETAWHRIPFPVSPLGRRLNAFNTWPDFDRHMVNVDKLKHECSVHFGSGGLATNWLPLLMRARHAFLSTICISAAHNEIMARHLMSDQTQSRTERTVRMAVRSEMMQMINTCISDPQLRTHDTTIVSVLQILSSEIMDDSTVYLHAHAKGLGELIQERGGLDSLGLKVGHGESLIALIIVATMYLIAILHETEVELTYRTFCERIHRTTCWPPRDSAVQSPLLCFGKLLSYGPQSSRSRYSETIEVLDQIDGLMHAYSDNFTRPVSQDDQYRMFSVIRLYKKKYRDRRASQDTRRCANDCSSSNSSQSPHEDSHDYRYEVVRLTSLLLGYALTEHMPLSIASQRLHELGFGKKDNQVPTAITKPPFVQIRNALMRTEIDTLWGNMSGVLFWVCLTAGAAASKATPPDLAYRMNSDEYEANECRKFFCAVAVRCMIKLVFDNPNTILETLRRMNRIQMRLRNRYYNLPDPIIVPADGRQDQGPAQGPQPPMTFHDYAWEFINLPPDPEVSSNPLRDTGGI